MMDVEEVLAKLVETEKCNLIAAADSWHTIAIPRLQIPAIRFSDGPNGVRGQHHFNSTKTTCFPAASGLAATWNKELILEVGALLAEECKLKGARLLLGPTVNIARGPLGGRAFESFSEDPVLSGLLAAEYIKGVQNSGIACALKHLVCNDQELQRNSADSVVSERTLREVYLMPFQLAVRDADPKSIMTSYNKLNGLHCSETPHLLQGILRDEWDWKGMVISDWMGTYSSVEAVKAGLDLEAPGPTSYRGRLLSLALNARKITMEQIDDRCRAVLKLINETESSGVQEHAPELMRDYEQDREFLKQLVSEGIVMLKRDEQVLPLSKQKSTAVIGYNARYTAYAGGGSSLVTPYYTVSPLDAIQQLLGKDNVSHELGAYSFKYLPTLGDTLKLDDGVTTGARIRIYNQPPEFPGQDRDLVEDLTLTDIGYFRMNDYYNDKLHDRALFYADIESHWTPEQTGTYLLGITVHGTAKLFIDGELVVDNATSQTGGTAFYGAGTSEVRSRFKANGGTSYKFHIQFGAARTSSVVYNGPENGGGGGLICGGILDITPEEQISRAAQLAAKSDQVIVIGGLNREWESEGADRPDMKLPSNNDAMIKAVLEANPNAVVVVQSGSPVDMTDWIELCSNLFHCSYGGNEIGSGLASAIFGDSNPSGKLPVSFPKRLQDNPTYLNWGAERGKVLYGEGVYVGYRYYEKLELPVAFPFGYGLSYTSFKMESLRVTQRDSELVVEVDVENVGGRAGMEVVQIYVGQLHPSLKRPAKELKEFAKVSLEVSEKQTVEVAIPLKYATSFWDEDRDSWASEQDTYRVFVGSSSRPEDCLFEDFSTAATYYWTGV